MRSLQYTNHLGRSYTHTRHSDSAYYYRRYFLIIVICYYCVETKRAPRTRDNAFRRIYINVKTNNRPPLLTNTYHTGNREK